MSTFIDACYRKPVSHTPIWLMRQAGRYQASYRAIREKVSFVELCKTSELAAQVTVQAIDDLGADAAIVFADILLILEPLGIDFEFVKGHGPKILKPLRSNAQIDAVAESINAKESLDYVMETIRLCREGLGETPLIGFAGAPFTLASYCIEGAGSRNYLNTKRLMYSDEAAWNVLMTKLSSALLNYLKAQVDAGAQAIQLFDSWVGALSEADYRRFVLPHSKFILDGLKDCDVPTLHFGTGNPALYPAIRDAGGDVIGVDWRVPLGEQWERIGYDRAIQGNLEPTSLLGSREEMFARADKVLAQAAGRDGHIFNLGHGVLPPTDVATAKALVDYVHEKSAR